MHAFLALVLWLGIASASSESLSYNMKKTSPLSVSKPYMNEALEIPNWEFSGNTVVTEDFIRLTPDRQSKRGALWSTLQNQWRNWVVELELKIHGQGKNGLHGDGIAFWYTKDSNVEGPVFGSKDKFVGLGLFLDTYNNNPGHKHAHPYLSAVVGDGTVSYDHDAEGTHSELAGCQALIRGAKHQTKLKIEYKMHTLSVYLDVKGFNKWDTCFIANGVNLPTGLVFGITAATGHLADNHDVISVSITEIELTEEEIKGVNDLEAAMILRGESVNKPHADHHAPDRDHVHGEETRKSSNKGEGSSGFLLFLLFLVIAAAGGYYYYLTKQSQQVVTGKRMV